MTTAEIVRPANERNPTQRDDMNELTRALWPHSKAAVLKLALMTPLARHRTEATSAQLAIAHVVAAAHEDCSACVRIAQRFGVSAGIDRATLRAVVRGEVEGLPEDLRLVHRLACEVVTQSANCADTAREVARRWGDAALFDIALAIAVARFFPTAKRAMGIAVSCSVGSIDV